MFDDPQYTWVDRFHIALRTETMEPCDYHDMEAATLREVKEACEATKLGLEAFLMAIISPSGSAIERFRELLQFKSSMTQRMALGMLAIVGTSSAQFLPDVAILLRDENELVRHLALGVFHAGAFELNWGVELAKVLQDVSIPDSDLVLAAWGGPLIEQLCQEPQTPAMEATIYRLMEMQTVSETLKAPKPKKNGDFAQLVASLQPDPLLVEGLGEVNQADAKRRMKVAREMVAVRPDLAPYEEVLIELARWQHFPTTWKFIYQNLRDEDWPLFLGIVHQRWAVRRKRYYAEVFRERQ